MPLADKQRYLFKYVGLLDVTYSRCVCTSSLIKQSVWFLQYRMRKILASQTAA